MSLNANKVKFTGDKVIPLIEPDTYSARLVQVLDFGLQKQSPYKGEDKKPQREINVTYEFSDEFMKDDEGEDIKDKPRWLSERFPFHNLQADRAISTKRYNAIDPNGTYKGEWGELLGSPCNVTVVENVSSKTGKSYNKIAAVSSISDKKASKMPEVVNPTKLFELDEPDMEVFFSLPEWIQTYIKGNLEFEGSPLDKALKENEGGETDEEENVKVKEKDNEDDEKVW